jgi:hypothetical protein
LSLWTPTSWCTRTLEARARNTSDPWNFFGELTQDGGGALSIQVLTEFYVTATDKLGAGCRLLWTEDLSNGQRYGSVTAQNPFRG